MLIDQSNYELWQNRYINPAENYIAAKKVMQEAEKANYSKGVAYAQLNMAMACFLQSQNREAFEQIGIAQDYFSENTGEAGYIWMLNLQASLFESIGNYDKALQLALKAFKLVKESKDFKTKESQKPGTKTSELKEVKSVEKENLKELRSLKSEKADSASILGLIYSRIGNHKKAIEHYQNALKIREDINDHAGVASSLNRIGMICRMTKDFEKSLEYYFKSLEIRKSNNLFGAIPWTMLGIASTYEEMEMTDKALDYYQKGLINSDKRCALQCEMGCGRIYSKTGNNEKAEQSLQKALGVAEELQAKALKAEIHHAFSKHYETYGQPAKALDAYKKYQKVKEILINEEAQNRLLNVEISHAVEKSEQEKEIYRLRNVELKAANDLIKEKNKKITDSINYASYIQQAILPDLNEADWMKDNIFVLYYPKDIVSGDFYWFAQNNGKTIVAAADCTGHGVPGALMSMLGISLLEEIVNKRNIYNAAEILNSLREEVIRSLKQNVKNRKSRDGMDISLCVIDKDKNKIQFAGAMNNLYIVRNGDLIEYKGDRMPIASHPRGNVLFTRHNIRIKTNDMIYLFSDGFPDQFGGEEGGKFSRKSLLKLFVEFSSLKVSEQREKLDYHYNNWKGKFDQIDDVVIVGIRIP